MRSLEIQAQILGGQCLKNLRKVESWGGPVRFPYRTVSAQYGVRYGIIRWLKNALVYMGRTVLCTMLYGTEYDTGWSVQYGLG